MVYACVDVWEKDPTDTLIPTTPDMVSNSIFLFYAKGLNRLGELLRISKEQILLHFDILNHSMTIKMKKTPFPPQKKSMNSFI